MAQVPVPRSRAAAGAVARGLAGGQGGRVLRRRVAAVAARRRTLRGRLPGQLHRGAEVTDVLRYELSDHVATVALNRPDAMNALNLELKEALRDALAQAAGDPAVRAVVLTGTGRAFCAGQD